MMVDLTKHMKLQLSNAKPSAILAFDKYASQIEGMVKLTVGEPDFNTPAHIKQAAIKAINANDSHYNPPLGTQQLRKNAANYFAVRHQQKYDAEGEIIITNGASEAIYATLTAILNPGDVVLLPTPTFPLYEAVANLAGATVVNIDTSKSGFVLTSEQLSAALAKYGTKVKALVLNYPNNPTGVSYSQKQLDELAAVVAGKPIFVIADEIYADLTYDASVKNASIAHSLREQTLVLSGVSKSHAMTGWRIGVILGPKELIKPISVVHQLTITTTASISQAAATAAFGAGINDADEMKAKYAKRREYLVAQLEQLGFSCAKAQGAFYVFAKIPSQFCQDDEQFCYDLAKKAKVAVIAGSYFGAGGAGFIRLSYATDLATIKEGIKRLASYVAKKN